ncbi:MAG: SDR family oxidoreductase [Pseudomonadota bacterium]
MTSEAFDLSGKTALVTGGGTGIGRAIAHALSDAGAYLIVIGRRDDKLKQTLETRNGLPIAVDLTGDGPLTTVKEACQSHGTFPDIIVNAAGLNPRKHADDVTPDDWSRTIHINLTVPFFLAQTFVPKMKEKKWGRIINIASLQSERAFKNGIAYGASKGGVSQMTRAMAEAWSKYGVTANALQPGFFPTELTEPVFGDDALANHHAEMTCIGRNGELSDLAGPAIFLASNASSYVTGQMLAVDGGYTAK